MTKIKKKDEEMTWASLSDADFCFHKFRASSSPVLWFFDDLPSFCPGSVAATSHTAFAPLLPIANFAVNWKCEALVKREIFATRSLGPRNSSFWKSKIVRKKSKNKQEDIRKFQNANPNKFIKKYELFASATEHLPCIHLDVTNPFCRCNKSFLRL